MVRKCNATSEERLARYDKAYWNEGHSLVSDAEYDALAASVGHRDAWRAVKVAKEKEVEHTVPLASLRRTYDLKKLIKWAKKRHGDLFLIEPKYDGIAYVARWANGMLYQVATSGTGLVGGNITEAVFERTTLTKEIRHPVSIEVRGEFYMQQAEYERICLLMCERGEKPYPTPRHAVSGLLQRADNPYNCRIEHVAFELLVIREQGPSENGNSSASIDTHPIKRFDSLSEVYSYLAELGLRPPSPVAVPVGDITTVVGAIGEDREDLIFPIDGAVIKSDACKDHEEDYFRRGELAHAIMAFKFDPPKAVTTVVGMIHTLGNDGSLRPTALVEPTDLGGQTITKVTLGSVKNAHMRRWSVGAQVEIVLAGDVAVAAGNCLNNCSIPVPPSACPACGGSVVTIGPHVYCASVTDESRTCPGVAAGQIERFFSRHGVKVDGLGPATIRQLMIHALVRTPLDLLTLDRMEWQTMPGGQAIYDNIQNQLAVCPLSCLLFALNIPGIGRGAAGNIAKCWIKHGDIKAAEEQFPRFSEYLQGGGRETLNRLKTMGFAALDRVMS